MSLIAGVDSSTQSCKIVVRDLATGEVVRAASAPHPDGTEVHPDQWWSAFCAAAESVGGLQDVAAIGVGGQQHGMVCLSESGEVVRPALLWNDTRSADAAANLTNELGAQAWATAVGLVPVASFTVAKLRWLATSEPGSLARTQAVCLPHDWLTWRLRGGGRQSRGPNPQAGPPLGIEALATDRGDASGTAYWSPVDGYRADLLNLACGRTDLVLPAVLGPYDAAGDAGSSPADDTGLKPGALVSAGTGDNMAAALGLGTNETDVVISIGTSGVVSVVSAIPTADPTGTVAGFADATGKYLPLICTLNAGQVIDRMRRLLGVSYEQFDHLALGAPDGAHGLTLLPFFNGERTPNRPQARGVLAGITLDNLQPAALARAAVEGLACGLADGLAAIKDCGVPTGRVILVGGAGRLRSLQQILASVLQTPVIIPPAGEYVANGAAVQAAWALTGVKPQWSETELTSVVEPAATPAAIDQYQLLRDATGPNAWP